MGRSYIVKYFAEDFDDIKKDEHSIYTGMTFGEVFEHFIFQNKGAVKGKRLIMFEQMKKAERTTPIIEFLQDFKLIIKDKVFYPSETWQLNNVKGNGYYPKLTKKNYNRYELQDFEELLKLYWII